MWTFQPARAEYANLGVEESISILLRYFIASK